MDAKRWICAMGIMFSLHSVGEPFQLDWDDGMLTISKEGLPGGAVTVHYIEAFCKSNAHDAEWSDSLIPHETIVVSKSEDRTKLELLSLLDNDVSVEHTITAEEDAIHFFLHARNPTEDYIDLGWAQPCIRVGGFTGTQDPDHSESYEYLGKSFVYVNGKQTRMPTPTWATEARYTPGQVWRAPHVPAKDVNPRPLNPELTSNGLIGCYSADESWILATAWEPYHELFQGVVTCLHSDFHFGGLERRAGKNAVGRIYIFKGDEAELLKKYRKDFPEHAESYARE